ncbi:putative malate:quinone oxidoreductase [Marinobacterium nitratireducens]|uniref:Probable malate:quinone oxidoreductase n=1 Tax=Marinobacterium nitratireducens TaxID=518897 RepID=A0A917ZD07_9GAMM|nr:malate dehydrogenase (quinone) [Marinobacterium nitratireducens]GGO81168.1 putative malate:quinone oxidoreductase [Marinobacterium nitratireducens]
MTTKTVDVLLVGAGAMSTTLGMLLKQLDPTLKITLVERLDHVAHESTDGWNNAGTGHAAYCELNYTPQKPDGSIDTAKAFAINSAFEVSLQFWSYLVGQNILPEPKSFINPTPHQSFVWGKENVSFLRKRFEALSAHPAFADMEYSEDPEVLREWMPLVMQNRSADEAVAGTRVRYGSDVDFGSLARCMASHLETQPGFEMLLSRTVRDLKRKSDGRWRVKIKNNQTGEREKLYARFVFLGAGGGALPLLQMSGIPEGNGYGGFPVSGQWLVCKKPEIVEQHLAKVYGKAPIGAPPMSVPHLDTRIINGEKALLFGPFAGFTTKFLKKGSKLDLPKSIKANNLKSMMSVGMNNMDLTRYLISEVMQSHDSRIDALRRFFPEARSEDWSLSYAGQRVQIIKKDKSNGGGKLEFGTEVITSEDGSLAALLGASPGASTAVNTMINIIERCFPEQMAGEAWQQQMKAMVPSYGQSLTEDPVLLKQVRQHTLSTLELDQLDASSPKLSAAAEPAESRHNLAS